MRINANSCRVCLKVKTKKGLIPLFSGSREGQNMVELVKFCTGIQLISNQIFPDMICRVCIKKLEDSSRIKEICIESDRQLQLLLKNHENVVENPENTVVNYTITDLGFDASCVEEENEFLVKQEQNIDCDDLERVKNWISENVENKSENSEREVDGLFSGVLTVKQEKDEDFQGQLESQGPELVEKFIEKSEFKAEIIHQNLGNLDNPRNLKAKNRRNLKNPENPRNLKNPENPRNLENPGNLENSRNLRISLKNPKDLMNPPNSTFPSENPENPENPENLVIDQKNLNFNEFEFRRLRNIVKEHGLWIGNTSPFHPSETEANPVQKFKQENELNIEESAPFWTSHLDETEPRKRQHKEWQKILTPTGNYECDHCGKDYDQRIALQKHMIDHIKHPKVCEICHKLFRNHRNLRLHHNRMHSELHVSCKDCCRKFANKTLLKNHSICHAPLEESPYKCEICNKRFRVKHYLKKHQLVHQSCICDYCGRRLKVKSEMARHVQIHLKDSNLQCSICGKDCASRESLRKHVYNNHSAKNYQCVLCDAKFVNNSSLDAHMMYHDTSGQNAVNCDMCGKQYKNVTYLRRHISTQHLRSDQFECIFCGSLFEDSNTLDSHLLTHNEGKPLPIKQFQCTVCERAYASKRSLLQHIENVCCPTPITNFNCQTCKMGFPSRQELTKHMRTNKACSLDMFNL